VLCSGVWLQSIRLKLIARLAIRAYQILDYGFFVAIDFGPGTMAPKDPPSGYAASLVLGKR